MAFLRYNEDNLIGAGARVLWAPSSASQPTHLSDVFDGTSPYDPGTDWNDFGATSGPAQISRNLTTAGFTIQQSTTALLEEPTEISRTLTVPIAEFSPAILALLEESTVSTYAAASGRAAGSKVPFGNIFSLSSFRLALVVQKSKQQAIVTEGGSLERGPFVGYVAYKASLVGNDIQTSIARGELASFGVQFKLYPDPAVTTEAAEMGMWLFETGATIAA